MAKTKFFVLTDTSSGIAVKKFKAGALRMEGHLLKILEYSHSDTLLGVFLMTPGIVASLEEEETSE